MRNDLQSVMAQHVVTVSPSQSVQEAAALMNQYNIGSIPVVENGQVRGIITDRDITLRSTAQGMNGQTPISQVMSQNLITATPQMNVDQAAQLMAQNQIRRLPVVENNQIVGMVALGDLATKQPYQDEAEAALANISTPNKTGAEVPNPQQQFQQLK